MIMKLIEYHFKDLMENFGYKCKFTLKDQQQAAAEHYKWFNFQLRIQQKLIMRNQKINLAKPFEGYLNTRSDFYNLKTNDDNVKKLKTIDEYYRQQPRRKGCKLCATNFQDELFKRNEIKYFICKKLWPFKRRI